MMFDQRWQDLMHVFQFNDNKGELDTLKKKYQEKHRAYHNLEHIIDCFTQLDNYKENVSSRVALELAIWYHDIIYNPYGKENELKSALESKRFLESQGAGDQLIKKVHDLILSNFTYPASKK